MEKGTCISVTCCANCPTKHHFFSNEDEANRFEAERNNERVDRKILSLTVAEAVLVDEVIYIKPRSED